MVANWKTELVRGFDELIRKDCPKARKMHEGKQACWVVRGKATKIAITLEFGKRSTIPEVAIGIYLADINDEYTVTSPAAKVLPFYPQWSGVKHLAGLSDETSRIKEKISIYTGDSLPRASGATYVTSDRQSTFCST